MIRWYRLNSFAQKIVVVYFEYIQSAPVYANSNFIVASEFTRKPNAEHLCNFYLEATRCVCGLFCAS